MHRSVINVEKVISHKHKFIAILTPKVARSSLLHVFTKSHADVFFAEKLEMSTSNMFSKTEYVDYFKFAFVRSPWERVLSCWKSKVSKPHNDNVLRLLEPYDGLEPEMSFDDFVKWLLTDAARDDVADRHWASQYLLVGSDGINIELDFIGRYESLQKDFNFICNKIGVPNVQLPMLNSSLKLAKKEYSKKNVADFYTSELIDIIGQRYKEDIKLFGFKPNF